jgi:alpha-tubulin suppressor-like RCC1 family protein
MAPVARPVQRPHALPQPHAGPGQWSLGRDGPRRGGGRLETGTAAAPVFRNVAHSLALKNDGTVAAWGDNAAGELGNGDVNRLSHNTPVAVNGLGSVTSLSTGSFHVLSLTRHVTSAAWGGNESGQLGQGSVCTPFTCGSPSPSAISDLPSVGTMSAGGGHSLALISNGDVWAWGSNTKGQLGNGSLCTPPPPPPPPAQPNPFCGVGVPARISGLSNIKAISAGGGHNLSLNGDPQSTVSVWGDNSIGQLGLGSGSPAQVLTPTPLPGLSGVTALAAGAAHSLALLQNGKVMAWGANSDGEVGDGTTTDRSTPTPVIGLSKVVAIAAGSRHSLALLANGTVMAWGANEAGELGNGAICTPVPPATNCGMSTPAPVQGLNAVAAVAGGAGHSLALLNNGTVWAFGDNNVGQLGDGTTLNRSLPVMVDGIGGVTAISAGGGNARGVAVGFSMALKRDGTVFGWGNNATGQIGNGQRCTGPIPGSIICGRRLPGAVSTLTGVQSISASSFHTLAILGKSWPPNRATGRLPMTYTIGVDNAVAPGKDWQYDDFFPRAGIKAHNGDTLHFIWNPASVDPEHTVTFLAAGIAKPTGFVADEASEPPLTVVNPTCNATCGVLDPAVFNPSDPSCGLSEANPCVYTGANFVHSGMQFDPGFEFFVKINVPITAGPVTLDLADLTHPNQIGIITVVQDSDNSVWTAQQVANKAAAQYQADTAAALAAEAAATATTVTNPDGTHTLKMWAGPGTFFTEVSENLPLNSAGKPSVTIHRGDVVTWQTTVIQDVHTVTFPAGDAGEAIDPLQHRCETSNPPTAVVPDATGDFISENRVPSDCVSSADYETHLYYSLSSEPECSEPRDANCTVHWYPRHTCQFWADLDGIQPTVPHQLLVYIPERRHLHVPVPYPRPHGRGSRRSPVIG